MKASAAFALLTISVAVVSEFASGNTTSEPDTQTGRVGFAATTNTVVSHGSNSTTLTSEQAATAGGTSKSVTGTTTSSSNEQTELPSTDAKTSAQATTTTSTTVHSTETWGMSPEPSDPTSTTTSSTVSSPIEHTELPSTDAITRVQTTTPSSSVHSNEARITSPEPMNPTSITTSSMALSTNEQTELPSTNALTRAETTATSSVSVYSTEPWGTSPEPNDPLSTTTAPAVASPNEYTKLPSTDAMTRVQTTSSSSKSVHSTEPWGTSPEPQDPTSTTASDGLHSSNSITHSVSANEVVTTTSGNKVQDGTTGLGSTSSAPTSEKPTDVSADLDIDRKLYNHLLGNYVNSARPVRNFKATVLVTIDTSLNTIYDLDEKNQILEVIMWIRLSWIDEHLKWNASDFYGMNMTAFRSSSLWTPDITLYTSAGGDGDSKFDVTQDTMAVVTSDGKVQWNFPAKISSNCPIDITYFPFDEQRCEIEFGSWVFNRKGIDWKVASKTVDLGSYGVNVEWEVRNFTKKKKVPTATLR